MILSVNETDVFYYRALERLGVDPSSIHGMRTDRAFELIVAKQFMIIEGLEAELENSAVLDCPYCGTSELLCGYPNNCCTKGEG